MKKRILYSEKYSRLTEDETTLLLSACKEVEKYVKRTPKVSGKKHKTRDVHAKSYGEVFGTFTKTVSGDKYINEIFPNKTYRSILRLSNVTMIAEEGKDSIPAYGLAIKLMNVADGLDFNAPLANFPIFPTNSVSKFLKLFIRINRLASAAARFSPLAITKAPALMLSALSFLPNFVDATFLRYLAKTGWNRNRNPLFFNYHSVGCYRLGDYIVKFLLEPKDYPKTKTDIKAQTQKQAVQEIFKNHQLTYTLKMQYCRKEEWVNDLTITWPHKKYKEIGTITIEADSVLNPHKAEFLSFSPFESPDILKPVGRIQKTREMVYRTSVQTRRKS